MKKVFAILIAVLLVGTLSTAAFARPDRDLKIDKDTAALLALGFGGYRDSFQPPGYNNPYGPGRHYGYQQGNHYGWRNQPSYSYSQYPPYRYQPRTVFRVRIGNGRLEWRETDRDSRFGYDSNRGHYRSCACCGHR